MDYTTDIDKALQGIRSDVAHYMRTQHGQHARTIPMHVVLDRSTGGMMACHDVPELLVFDRTNGHIVQSRDDWKQENQA